MKKFLVVLFVFCTFVTAVFGKHIHPRSIVHLEEDARDINAPIIIDVISHISPSRFVPVNDEASFTKCEDGFEKDLLGVCREVWK